MRIRSFIIAYALVLAILLFADRRPSSSPPARYSHVIDLTSTPEASQSVESRTRIIAPGAMIPGTWSAGQIPAERLVAPLVIIDLPASDLPTHDLPSRSSSPPQLTLDDIAAWETRHGMIPQGAVIAIRRQSAPDRKTSAPAPGCCPSGESSANPLPINPDAVQFLSDARYAIGFAVETPVDLTSDRTLARQLALHGNYVLEETAPLTALPATGSLLIVAPTKTRQPGKADVRVLAMVR